MGDDVRAIGEVSDIHGSPLIIGIYRGCVNIDGRMLNREQAEEFAQLFVRAAWEAASHG